MTRFAWVLAGAAVAMLGACASDNDQTYSSSNTGVSTSSTDTTPNSSTPDSTMSNSKMNTVTATSSQQNSSSGMSPGSQTLSDTDRDFMNKAAAGGIAEVQGGQLAVQRASNPAVQKFGQRMVQDHTKANRQLQQLARQMNIDLPTKPDSESQQMMQQLTSLNGSNFDQQYIQHMVQDHEKDVAEFERAAQKSDNPAVKNFAQQTLPTLREHLRMARTLNSQLNNAPAGASGGQPGAAPQDTRTQPPGTDQNQPNASPGGTNTSNLPPGQLAPDKAPEAQP